ncbi:MAG: 50S ribosomal protein L25 [Candidatus Cloacimonetes bacterium]|nr:50S ribosomal protein L25 [Candidatus Cloacimonadota bacterium]
MNVKIKAEIRNNEKKSDLKKIRKDGFIPGIIYGDGKEGIRVIMESIPFRKIYKKTIGEMAFFDIEVNGKNYKTIIKDKQVHPVSQDIMHIDFLELHEGKALTLNIPLKFVGDPVGVSEGGLMEILVRELEISCLPKDIPEEIEIDVSNLGMGETIHLADINLENIETKTPLETTLVAIRAPKEEVEEGIGEEVDKTAEESEEVGEEPTE